MRVSPARGLTGSFLRPRRSSWLCLAQICLDLPLGWQDQAPEKAALVRRQGWSCGWTPSLCRRERVRMQNQPLGHGNREQQEATTFLDSSTS